MGVMAEAPAKKTPKSLQIGVLKRIPAAECPRKSQNGDKLSMHYTGTLWADGSKFDSQVIKGWDQGLLDMCIGEKRKLIIPPALGYGDRGAGAKIPGGSVLVFTVELLKINGQGAAGEAERDL
ncbi:hypothetical protein BCR33DRAFT_714371 [Rhizoclosmatium globosum]|uniref:peptidylprolyl isomerase n=1 Tax=Rhizoclosmatium globosum TaxID=329046 RepID=A0A1Y2CQK9_9FUNG|nr:hypothetical protein BCR33DRAFT_714371 [Rhizoclosmatium globosum]|eukprot:ORY48635.1 hypothetical protein BCR33DRAFT_714371 [Rhizoclosmatium globosum]